MRIELYGQSKLEFISSLYEEACAASADLYERMNTHLAQYKGSKQLDGSEVPASMVRNITYELVESQVTSYIPNPLVTPEMWSESRERNAKSIEELLRAKRNKLPFEEMNDIDERFNPIYGGSVWLIEWDNSIRTHNTVGDVKISCVPPHKFVGQPNIYSIDDMEYCFITFETTKEDIVRKYGVSVEIAESTQSDSSNDDKTATLIVCYYKDDEDRVCQYIWSGDTELVDIEDYYARKKEVCKKCGRRRELCSCEGTKDSDYEATSDEYEELTADIKLSDGSVIPAMSEVYRDGQIVYETVKKQALDEMGNLVFDKSLGVNIPVVVDVQVPKYEPTRLPYYTPKRLPIVIRKNTSCEDSLFGQSDCEYIRPQQQAINKIESRILQKLLRAGVTPVVPEDASITTNNSIFGNVIRMKPGESLSQYGKIDTTPDISRDLAEAERLYDQAKRILGISDSFQGQYDSSAQSGKAKQLQIQQAAGRLDSKRKMKNAAYAVIDRIIFEYYLAYADEPRPAAYRDAYGRYHNISFNRYDFIERDENGCYYYADDYLFETDATIDPAKDKPYIWSECRLNLSQGAYGDPTNPNTLLIFWLNMERAGYPNARENVERITEEIERQRQIEIQQEQINGLQREVAVRDSYEGYLQGEVEKLGGRINGKQ